ncbi:ATP-dependent Clp protease ATP-binding subunit [Carnobacteriaceae bacterium zg-C25]|nr:ATP-dependent Clp protease ATP-binding subunit [Carnobacteriaceae bacterium zg-C25]
MTTQYTESLTRVLDIAKRVAQENKNSFIYSEHLLYAFLEDGNNSVYELLSAKLTVNAVRVLLKSDHKKVKNLTFSNKTENIFANAKRVMEQTNSQLLGTEHVLVGMLQEDCVATKFLNDRGFSLEQLIKEVYQSLGFKLNDRNELIDLNAKQMASTTPVLNMLAKDLNEAVLNGEIGKVIGRNEELTRIIQILGRKNKNNPVLVGEAGVGKTVIADGLARMIVEGKVPDYLKNKRVFSLDVGTLVAGTKYRGEFEERMKRLVDEISQNKNIILFVDEMHMLIGAGGAEGSVDAANILKPALARGSIQLLGATTFNEYQKHIEKDAALERRFSPVSVNEPSIEETIAILKGVMDEYEAFHQVVIDEAVVETAVKLSARYISDRKLPDKAFDVLDEASAIVKNQTIGKKKQHNADHDILQALLNEDFNNAAKELRSQKRRLTVKDDASVGMSLHHVTKEAVEKVVSQWTGIPLTELKKDDKKRLLELERVLHERVIGQNEAINAVSKAIRRSKSGVTLQNRPIGSFMFLGPTGVGKTELAKSLAQVLFGSDDHLIRVDMSEFMEKHSVSRLVGSPPGYVGFEEGGQLTEKIRKNPYAVVLFDEIEKAHPDTFNILLQVLDDGFLTDSKGRKIDFRNTLIIMTSNLGATALKDQKTVGFNAKSANNMMESVIRAELKKAMRPEFLNRIDEIVIFKELTKKEIEQIVKLMVKENFKHLQEESIRVELSPKAIEKIATKGYDVEYGARPIRRVLQNEIEDKLSVEMLKGNIVNGVTVKIGVQKDKFTFKFEK